MNELENLHNDETNDTSFDHVLKYTGVFGGVQGLKMLMSATRNKLTSIFLGGAGMGLIGVLGNISEFMVSCCNFGIPLNATRRAGELFEEGTEGEIRHFVAVVRTWVAWSAALAAVLCAACSPLLSYIFFDHDTSQYGEVLLMIPVVVALLVAEGECAVLKGLRQLRKVAIIESACAVLTLVLTVPFYYLLGMRGVAYGLIASGIASAFMHLLLSTRLVAYRIHPFSAYIFREGRQLATKGIPYVVAGIANSALAMLVPAIMLMSSTMEDVGFYRAGYMLMAGYAGMAFVALESDFFPRLSSVNHDIDRMNQAINQQIEVCILIIAPMLIVLILFMPWIIPLLYEPSFMAVLPMALCATFYTFFRAISLPIGYSILAKGELRLYLLMEVVYDLFFGGLIWLLFSHFHLMGAGVALSLGALFDVVVYKAVTHYRYGVRIRRSTWLMCLVQFVCLSAAVVICLFHALELRYFIGGIAFVLSLYISSRHISRLSETLGPKLGFKAPHP